MPFRVLTPQSGKSGNVELEVRCALAIRGAIIPKHCLLTLGDRRREAVRPYHLSSPPRHRLLARRPLDLGLGLRVQTLAADHRDASRTSHYRYSYGSAVAVVCLHRIARRSVVSYDF